MPLKEEITGRTWSHLRVKGITRVKFYQGSVNKSYKSMNNSFKSSQKVMKTQILLAKILSSIAIAQYCHHLKIRKSLTFSREATDLTQGRKVKSKICLNGTGKVKISSCIARMAEN